MPLSAESLLELKQFFDVSLENTLHSLKTTDSERLVKNKINGFLIALQDRLFDLKPKMMCYSCSRAVPNTSQEFLDMSQQMTMQPGNNKDFNGLAARSNLLTDVVSQKSNIEEDALDEIEQIKLRLTAGYQNVEVLLNNDDYEVEQSQHQQSRRSSRLSKRAHRTMVAPTRNHSINKQSLQLVNMGNITEEERMIWRQQESGAPYQDVAPAVNWGVDTKQSSFIRETQSLHSLPILAETEQQQSSSPDGKRLRGSFGSRKNSETILLQTLKKNSIISGKYPQSTSTKLDNNYGGDYPERYVPQKTIQKIPIKKQFATPNPNRGKSLGISDPHRFATKNGFDLTLPNLTASIRSSSTLKKFDARQPKAAYQVRPGESEEPFQVDLETKDKLHLLVQANFDNKLSESVFNYDSPWAKTHLTLVKVPHGFTQKKYIVMSNPAGKVDIIELGQRSVYKQLPIEAMHCSFVYGNKMFIGGNNKFYLVDLASDFAIVDHCSTKRHIFSICAMSSTQFVLGQQGGYLAMVEIRDDGALVKTAENKVTSAIFKVIKTSGDEFALACSGGLYFAKYEAPWKRFVVSSDFLLVDHIVTQVVEVAIDRFIVGLWGVSWVALVDKKQRTLIKVECPISDETQCTDLVPLTGFDAKTFPFLIQRNSKAVNLISLASMSMHRLLQTQNSTGSHEKLVIDADERVYEQMKLLFVTSKSSVVEATLESTFVRQLKDIVALKQSPFK